MKMEDVLRKINKVGEDFGKMMSCLPNNYCNGYMQAIRDCKAQFYGDVHIVESDKKAVTNGDRIRNMSDKELAELLAEANTLVRCKDCSEPMNEWGSCIGNCENAYLKWLKEKV